MNKDDGDGGGGKTKIYDLRQDIFEHFPEGYPLLYLVPDIIFNYLEREDVWVMEKLAPYCHRSRIHDSLASMIADMNSRIGEDLRIPPGMQSIIIPSAVFFYRSVFPTFDITCVIKGEARIGLKIGVLDRLEYAEELEDIVRTHRSGAAPLRSLQENSRRQISGALHAMKIHTASSPDDQYMEKAVKIFQREMMGMAGEFCTGGIDSQTLLAMNRALKDPVRLRELSFFHKTGGEKVYFAFDMDEPEFGQMVMDMPSGSRGIWAQERGNEREFDMGYGTKDKETGSYGTQRFVRANPLPIPGNSMAKVIFAVSQNEGGDSVNQLRGGYDTVNTYDRVALSVGLFHWNQDWLWELLHEYKTNEGTKNAYADLSKKLGIDIPDAVKGFIIDGVPYDVEDSIAYLRRLKYAYYFLCEAKNPNFQAAQDRTAGEWVDRALKRSLTDQPNSRELREYVTSELAVALYVDTTMLRGERGGGNIIRTAINSFPQNLRDNPGAWGQAQEDRLIDAIDIGRAEVGMADRGERIRNVIPRLDNARGSFR